MAQQPDNQNQQGISEQQLTAFIFDNFPKKVEKGIIKFKKKNGVATLVHKNLNSLQEEVDPIVVPFSSTQQAKIRISRRNQRDQLELQMLQLQDQIAKLDEEDETTYSVLEAKIRELEGEEDEQ